MAPFVLWALVQGMATHQDLHLHAKAKVDPKKSFTQWARSCLSFSPMKASIVEAPKQLPAW
jgi:hypothetical protein